MISHKVGQRWLWDCGNEYGRSKFIAEIISDSNMKVLQCFTTVAKLQGYVENKIAPLVSSLSMSDWKYLSNQDKNI
jgi:hypothetical protein